MWPFSSSANAGLSFRKIDPNFAIAGQILPADVKKVAEAGFKTIVCARPDGEEPGQPTFAAISTAAKDAGLEAVYIPVSGSIGEGQIIRIEDIVKRLPSPMFGYCRSGARAGSLFNAAKAAMR
ncbi:MAG: TIGR01244 family phosphatase [Devosia sp.]|uniref:TIGR01244 family sulfur transferase n=1 Tax=Devosia sp. 66-22 TaxID=1895753 RepID=UPI000925CBA3|nr:TIGR01244 family sulfur transferase [Devosia sp. 66-22]MBN9348077.1 TIGR01244 family phosphatase [Devosia sp.]OJX46513.1 MAG: TIGR01244 family protein [Devosia sp. 66-22]